MASRSFHDLFLRARDQFAGSSRWLYLGTLALAILHVTIVTPLVEGSRLELETVSDRSRLTAVERGLAELQPSLEAVRRETSSTLDPILERLIEDLEHDLARLEATRRKYSTEAGETGDVGDEPTSDGTQSDAQIAPFVLGNTDWIADLRAAETRAQMLAALTPMVEELIAGPRFFDLERGWKDSMRPRLKTRLDIAAGTVPRLRGRFPEAEAQWDAFAGSLAAVGRAAQELRFAVPAEPLWWTASSPDGALALGLTAANQERIRRPAGLQMLRAATDRAFERLGEVTQEVERAKRELAALPAAGTLPGLDLAALVAMFPLLLGMILGGGAVWRSQRLRELGFTTRMAIEHGGPTALRQWFWSQIQWRTAAGSSAASAWQSCVLQTLLGYLLAMTWIGLAAIQLRRLETSEPQRLMIFAAAGAALVLFAVIHRLLVARRAITLLEARGVDGIESAEGAAGFEDATASENSDLIDARTLRR